MNTPHHHASAIAMLIGTSALAAPFTYQGSLQDSGTPANGTYDFQLELYDALLGGAQTGPTLTFNDVIVTDGLFEIELNFGDVFNEDDAFISIEVRDGASVGPYTLLTPRSPVTATPKAQHATTAASLLNPQWTEAPGLLHFGDGNDRVFINRSTPITGADYFGVHANTSGFVGMYTSGPAGALPFYGYSVDGATSAYTYFQPSDNSWILVSNGFVALTVDDEASLSVGNDLSANNISAASVTALNYDFATARTNYASVMGDAFHSASADPFIGSSGNGGTYISTPGSGWLVAPIQLPHGATVTKVRFYFTDNSVTGSMNMTLSRRSHGSNGFATLASLDSTGFNGDNLQAIDSIISNAAIDNNLYSYHLRVWSTGWDGTSSMQIESAVVEYTTTQAD